MLEQATAFTMRSLIRRSFYCCAEETKQHRVPISAGPASTGNNRFHEINQVYGTTVEALVHEEFGDGIMSAIDFELDIKRIPDPHGDRVQITYNGKFLPSRKW